jgi:multidrug resistance efflux pump
MLRDRALFRQEAVDFHQHRQQWGDVASLQPVSTKIATWFLAVMTAGLIAFLFIAQYARKETAVGYLTPTKGTAKVFVPRRGAIREVHVEEGDSVVEGQPLLTIDTDQIASDGSDVRFSTHSRRRRTCWPRTSRQRSSARARSASVSRWSSADSNPRLPSCNPRSFCRRIASSSSPPNCRQPSS